MRCLLATVLLGFALVATDAAVAAPAAPARFVDVVVMLKSQADLSTVHGTTRASRLGDVENALRRHADRTQQRLRSLLTTRRSQGLVQRVVPLWIANEIVVRATPAVVRELARHVDVAAVRPEFTVQAPASGAPAAAPTAPVETNVSLVNAPALWQRGFAGQGVVVANMDTGVDPTHADLSGKWRGGTNSWYDPNGQHPTTPTDVSGHGTWTMGVMVGGASGGSSIGMAPDAQWIAVKIFNDRGVASSGNIHLGFQWLLDPDGNPATPDAPSVVNDSWTMSAAGCSLEFQLDLRSIRAAGILPVFAAGNNGPSAETVFSPANNPEAFAVGGTDNADAIDPSSGRGASACAGATAPQLTAPGVGVRTTDLYGGYATETGTSLSAPHVSGALALLLNAFPHLSAEQQAAALQSGARDLGPAGLDTDFGYGRLDVGASYQWLATAPDFTVAASPASITVAPGGTASYGVSVAGVRGFSGDMALTVSGLSSSQATATLAPSVVTGGSGSSQLSVATAATIAPGTYPLTITATSGAIVRTATTTLVVPAPPDFSVAASPSSRAVSPGAAASFAVNISAMNGFAGDVALSMSGLPAAVGSATVTPASVTAAGTAQLVATTSATAPPGSYSLTVTGTSGSMVRTASMTLVVNAPPDFTVAVTPPTRTVVAGSTGSYTVNVGAVNGFAAGVTLSLSGLAASVGSSSFAPTSVGGTGSVQLTIATAASAPPGSYPLTITGTSGSTTRSATATLVVPARDFALSASPSSTTVFRGQTASYQISVAPSGGFNGGVTLSSAGLPGGTSVTYGANPVSAGGTSTMRVRTTGSTPRGTFAVKVSGKSGSLVRQATITLVVR
ncbi:MAG: bacillopeptidase [Pseudonocardiales bacterium]|nr:bacillopeptidase [Pseudonocardiales bacterium]